MAGDNRSVRLWVRAIVLAIFFLVLFYLGRPLYWKLSATMQEVRETGPLATQGAKHSAKEGARIDGDTLMPADTKLVASAGKKNSHSASTTDGSSKAAKPKAEKKAGEQPKLRKLSTRKLAQFTTSRPTFR